MRLRVSVVVPTFRRPELLARCLAALDAQQFPPRQYEVIVADNGGDEATRAVVEQWARQSRTRLRYISATGTPGPAFARNLGWRAARGDVIAFTDDDCVPEPDWLAAGIAALEAPAAPMDADVVLACTAVASLASSTGEQPGRGGPPALPRPNAPGDQATSTNGAAHGLNGHAGRVSGSRHANGHATSRSQVLQSGRKMGQNGRSGRLTERHAHGAPRWSEPRVAAATGRIVMPLPSRPTDYEQNEARLTSAGFVTANCFVRREVLDAVGGFDERFHTAWREDSDLHFSLLEAGYRVVHVDEAVVVHPLRAAPWGISLKLQRKSLFNALLYKKHPVLYRQYIQPRPPWHYYAAVAALLLAVGGSAAGLPAVALPAAAAWAALTGRFCWRRLRETSWAPSHVAEMLLTSALIPPLSVYWRLRGAWKFRVLFL